MQYLNQRTLTASFFGILIACILSSCSFNKVNDKDLIGNWQLIEVKGENNFEKQYQEKNRTGFDDHYLIFANDSVTSLEQPCYFLDQGKYSIASGKLILDFGSWKQTSTISLKDTVLKLTRLEGKSSNTYIYAKVKTYDTLNLYSDPAKGNWHNPACFKDTYWELIGRKRISSSDYKTDTIFTIPQTMHIDGDCSWEKCILRIPYENSWINLYATKYNGKEMEFVPYTPFGTYHAISDSIYTYRLTKH